MANVSRPNGLQPAGQPLRINAYTAAAAIYPGDPVVLNNAGKVARAAPSAALLGAAVSYAAGDGAEVLVADHPDQYFKIQSNASNVAAQTDLNLNYNLAETSAAFNTAYKMSRVQMAAASGSTGATLPLKLLGISREVNNDFGTSVKCIVKINNHSLNGGTGTAGV